MLLPWPPELLPEAALFGLAMAIGGALIGGWIGARLGSDRTERTLAQRWAGALGAALVMGLVGFGLLRSAEGDVSATVDLRPVPGGADENAEATVTLDPRDAADNAEWFHAISWQGAEPYILDELEQTEPGVYRTTEALPVDGTWKTLLRLHEGNSLTLAPVHLPPDPAIPAEGVRATDGMTREFVAEKEFLQREAKADPGPLALVAYLIVLAITLAFLSVVAWGLHRLAVAAEQPATDDGTSTTPARPPTPVRAPTVATR
jgi:hypothetical protein